MFETITKYFSSTPPPKPSLVPQFSSNYVPPRKIIKNNKNWNYKTAQKQHTNELHKMSAEVMSPVLYGRNGNKQSWRNMRWNQTKKNINKLMEPVSWKMEDKLWRNFTKKHRTDDEISQYVRERVLLQKNLEKRRNKYMWQRLREEKIMENELKKQRNKLIEKNIQNWDKELQERESLAQARGSTIFEPLTANQEENLAKKLSSNRYMGVITNEDKNLAKILSSNRYKGGSASSTRKLKKNT